MVTLVLAIKFSYHNFLTWGQKGVCYMSFEISFLVPNNDHTSVGQKILSVGKIKQKDAIISR